MVNRQISYSLIFVKKKAFLLISLQLLHYVDANFLRSLWTPAFKMHIAHRVLNKIDTLSTCVD
jgi:hypothetical protein